MQSAGTSAIDVQVRLLTPISSSKSKAGEPVRVVTIAPLSANGRSFATAGCTIAGQVVDVHHPKGLTGRETIVLTFSSLVDARGGVHPIKPSLLEVDNARETVDEEGRIVGLEPIKKPTSPEDALFSTARGGAMRVGAFVASKFSRHDLFPQISYAPGVELNMRLSLPSDAPTVICAHASPAEIRKDAALAKLVAAQPFRTTAKTSPKPADVTNVMFLGTQAEVVAAFTKAGWTTAESASVQSSVKTFLAVAAGQGYKEGPVSTLLLDGKVPDLVFQKQLNTFAKRHHIRIWRREGAFQGAQVWVGAATHDTGITISKATKWFTHSIDSKLDEERAKVVNDLAFCGAVRQMTFVERPNAPKVDVNASGDKIQTDSRMAVVQLQ